LSGKKKMPLTHGRGRDGEESGSSSSLTRLKPEAGTRMAGGGNLGEIEKSNSFEDVQKKLWKGRDFLNVLARETEDRRIERI